MIILACATERESRALLAGLAESGLSADRVLSCVTGVGPAAAGVCTGEILARFPQAAGMINAGICGSFDLERFPLGGICVAQKEIWPEYGVRTETDTVPLGYPMFAGIRLAADNEIDLDPASSAKAMGLSLPDDWGRGVSLTVAGVSGDRGRAEFLRRRHGAATENMEGFTLALAAVRRGIPFLEIRAVSNLAGERDQEKWDFRQAFTALRDVLPALLGRTA